MSEELTAEETAAMEAMQADTGEGIEDTQPAEPEAQEQPEQPAEQPAEPEQKAEEQPAEEDKRPPEGYVPHGALHREREERKRLAAELEEIKRWREEMQAPKKDEPPQYVDPLVDPEGFRKWAEYSQSQSIERAERIRKKEEEQERQDERLAQAVRLEQEFAAKTPDYKDAVQHLHNSRISELRNQGLSDPEIGQQIQKDANALFDAAQQMGMNPAELAYYRARSMGYQGKAPEPAQPDPAQRIEAQAKAQRETQSLGQGGGGSQAGEITAAQIASMSEAEFANLERENPAAIRKAMGG